MTGSPAIEYRSANFSHGLIPPIGKEEFTWSDLIWAAVTVGRGSWFDVLRFGDSSLHEIIFRTALLKMALKTAPAEKEYFCSEAYRNLDPSEKGAVSYFIGLTMCKLFAERFLGVPWLLHLDLYREQLDPSILAGRSRPDLVGKSLTGQWIVFESKGRSSPPSEKDGQSAKRQASRLTHVGNQQVAYGVALFSFFKQTELKVFLEDPIPSDWNDPMDSFSLEVRLSEFMRDYYQPIIQAVGNDRARQHLETREPIEFRNAGFKLSFHESVLSQILEENYEGVYELLREEEHTGGTELSAPFQISPFQFQGDGILVEADESWWWPAE